MDHERDPGDAAMYSQCQYIENTFQSEIFELLRLASPDLNPFPSQVPNYLRQHKLNRGEMIWGDFNFHYIDAC